MDCVILLGRTWQENRIKMKVALSLNHLVLIAVTFLFLCLQLGLEYGLARQAKRLLKAGLGSNSAGNGENQERILADAINVHEKIVSLNPRQNGDTRGQTENKMVGGTSGVTHQLQATHAFIPPLHSNHSSKDRLEQNRERVIKVCNRFTTSDKASRKMKYKEYAFERLKWCSIPKSGTTFLTRDLLPTVTSTVNNWEKKEAKTFLIVREPYSRLLSGYFSKFVGHPAWWRKYGGKIISKFRQSASGKSQLCGNDVTFQEFIKYFIYSYEHNWTRNGHFLPMSCVCDVCAHIPDFVGKLETVSEDMEIILNSVNLTGDTGKGFIEVKHLALLFMSFKPKFQHCAPMCDLLKRFWWGQQATGIISDDLALPFAGQECDSVTGEQLAEAAWEAHVKSLGQMNKQEQKKRHSIQQWRQIPLKDRLSVRKILTRDCELFGYDCSPDFVFPKDAS